MKSKFVNLVIMNMIEVYNVVGVNTKLDIGGVIVDEGIE